MRRFRRSLVPAGAAAVLALAVTLLTPVSATAADNDDGQSLTHEQLESAMAQSQEQLEQGEYEPPTNPDAAASTTDPLDAAEPEALAAQAPGDWQPLYQPESTCVAVRVGDQYLGLGGAGYWLKRQQSQAHPLLLSPAGLSRWTIRDAGGNWLYQSIFNTVMKGSTYGNEADWTLQSNSAGRTIIQNTFTGMGMAWNLLGGSVLRGEPAEVTLEPATGCYQPRTIDSGVAEAAAALPQMQGLADGHTHITAALGFGGLLKCGVPFSPGGDETALAACASHSSIAPGSIFNAAISGQDLAPLNAGGWPDFGTWPRHNQLLFEQSYYKGIERAWRAGLRVINNYFVSNEVICSIYPLNDGNGCNEMESIWRQYDYLYEMQDYIDAVAGGPGMGFFRIATSPAEVRQIMADGKLAVVMGIETSELFGCREVRDAAQCTEAEVLAGVDELVQRGIMRTHLVHKFDNAFGGTRFDPGTQGVIINAGQLLRSGHWWQTGACEGTLHDNEIGFTNDDLATALALGATIPHGTVLPVYPSGPACNVRGMTPLGEFAMNAMMDRGMIIAIDHMSVRTAQRALDLAEARGYAGLSSDHTWSDPGIVQRILGLGGFVSAYAFDAHDADAAADTPRTFVQQWRSARQGEQGAAMMGFGFGSDSNGLGAQPGAPGIEHAFDYPFVVNGATFSQSRWANMTWDYNEVGVAHYGMYAEWYRDVIDHAGADATALEADLMNGANALVTSWEAAGAAAVNR